MLEFSPNGTQLLSIGKRGVAGDNSSTDAFNGVSDVAEARNGDLFVSDGEGGNSRVVKFSHGGRFITAWGTKGAGIGELSGPHCVAVDSRDRVWVCDRGNKRLQLFDRDGKYLTQMAQFGTPVSVAFSARGQVYVASPAPENKVTVGTLDGTVIEEIGGLNSPHGIAVDGRGAVYVAESAGKAILKFLPNETTGR